MCRVPTFAAVRLLAGLVGIVIACMLSGHVQAAKISCISARYSNVEGLNELYPGKGPKLTPNDCVEIYIEGDIGKGDYQAFVSLLRIAEPHVREVSIISPGGDVTEAIKIGEVIRGRMLETQTAYRGDKGIYKLPSMGPDGLEYNAKVLTVCALQHVFLSGLRVSTVTATHLWFIDPGIAQAPLELKLQHELATNMVPFLRSYLIT